MGQTLSFLFDSLYLLSHPCDKFSEERVRLCMSAFAAGPSCLVQIPTYQGFWKLILESNQPYPVEAGVGAVCLPTEMPKISPEQSWGSLDSALECSGGLPRELMLFFFFF